MNTAHLTLNDRGIQTNDGNFVLLHGTQQLLQLLLRSHILHLAQAVLLEFHWDSSSLQVSISPSTGPGQVWQLDHPSPTTGYSLTLNTSLTACMSSGPTPSPGNMVTGKAPSTFTSSACEWDQRRWSRGRSRSQRETGGERKPRGADKEATRMGEGEAGLERTWVCEAA